jgi:Mg-chelatase subunit ChlD
VNSRNLKHSNRTVIRRAAWFSLKAGSCNWVRRTQVAAFAVVMLLVANDCQAQAGKARLEVFDKVRMVEFPGHPEPYFRMSVNIVNEKGEPAPLPVPKEDLKSSVRVREGGNSCTVYLVEPTMVQGSGAQAAGSLYALLLLDVSGSMQERLGSETKFEAAKAAASRAIQGFRSTGVRIGVAPFESHQVKVRIRETHFTDDIAVVQQQIDSLPEPEAHFNTALYSATYTALEVLEERKNQDPAAQMVLIVLTDGQNEVGRGDDPGLLDGQLGLGEVVRKADQVGVQLMTIGFGDESIPLGSKGAIDAAALRKIAWPAQSNFRWAHDQIDLNGLIRGSLQKLLQTLRLTFRTVRTDRNFNGRDLHFGVELKLDEGPTVAGEGGKFLFPAPSLVAPPWEDKLTPKEIAEVIKNLGPVPPPPPPGGRWVWRLVLLAVLGGMMAFLWYGLPGLMWPQPPERFVRGPISPPKPQPIHGPKAVEVGKTEVVMKNAKVAREEFKPRRPDDFTNPGR